MTTPAYQRERRRLAEKLKALRAGAGLSGSRLAEQLGWQQSKVSKIETMRQLPGEEDVTAWATATGATAEDIADLRAGLRNARVEYAGWKDTYRTAGAAGVQAAILTLEAQSTRIAEFQPGMISGLLQTAEYARESLHLPCGPLSYGEAEEEIARTVATRLQRQQALYEPGKRVQVIMLEGALRTRIVSAATLAGQLDRLTAMIGLPNLQLGIIPFEATVPVWPFGFRLYDDLVILEGMTGENQLAGPDEVSRYEKYVALLTEAASTGREATTIIQRALNNLRQARN